MDSICRKQFFIPAEEILDVEAKLIYIYKALVDLNDSTHSCVAIEYDLSSKSVSVICDEFWKYKIYLNDDKKLLLMEHKNWISMYGKHLKKEDQQIILSSFPRLDVICDTDEGGDFDKDFEAITEYLQLNLAVPYSFDPIRRRFIVHQ